MKTRVFLLFIFLLGFSFAQISILSLDTTLDQSGYAFTKINAEFESYGGRTALFNLSGNYDQIIARDSTGLFIPFESEKSGNFTIIHVVVPTSYVELELGSDDLTKKEAAVWSFNQLFRSDQTISSLSASLLLPKNSEIKSTNGGVSINEDALKINWDAQHISNAPILNMRAGYSLFSPESEWLGILPYVIGSLTILVVAFVAYFVFRKKHQITSPHPTTSQNAIETHSIFTTLDETDKEIIREIANQSGKTTQAHIYLFTHVPKATLSRRLASLENKGIIARSQKGNRKLVTLGELFKSK